LIRVWIGEILRLWERAVARMDRLSDAYWH
jgi:hypothetical protein